MARPLVPWLLALAVLAPLAAGCRNGPVRPDGPDPDRPGSLDPCPAAHLAVLLRASDHEAVPRIVRFDGSLRACQGAALPDDSDYDSPRSIGGLDDGSELVGFAGGYSTGGILALVSEGAITPRLEHEEYFPVSIAAVDWGGTPAVAVLWGDGDAGREEGEQVEVYAQSDLSRLGAWSTGGYPYETAIAPASTGQANRLATVVENDLQEVRADPGGETLATTDELFVGTPSWTGRVDSLDVRGDRVVAGGSNGVVWWRRDLPNAFLGPLTCRWGHLVGTPLPEEGAEYGDVAIDAEDPDATLVIVSGTVAGDDGRGTHLYRLHRRGECELVYSAPDTHEAVALGWAGPR
ncbi:MAG TPA: hypothetical protein RMH99_06445 [Sandaracinaceae bacterium LLY-WYZ-13_1]|nr:hypothetical protein [Sandaracinaceae bacterium LLY-WYZ-13_1]